MEKITFPVFVSFFQSDRQWYRMILMISGSFYHQQWDLLINIYGLSLLIAFTYLVSRINLKENKEVSASGFCLDKECWRLYEQKMQSVLHQGLSDRAKIVRVAWKNTPSEYSIENV